MLSRNTRRIFALRHGSAKVPLPPPEEDAVFDPVLDTNVVDVTVSLDRNEDSELLAELEKLMTGTADGARVISAASDVIAFHIVRPDILPPYSQSTSAGTDAGRSQERKPFKYPAHLYLDQFLRENYETTRQQREERRAMLAKAAELEGRKYKLTHHKVIPHRRTIDERPDRAHSGQGCAEGSSRELVLHGECCGSLGLDTRSRGRTERREASQHYSAH